MFSSPCATGNWGARSAKIHLHSVRIHVHKPKVELHVFMTHRPQNRVRHVACFPQHTLVHTRHFTSLELETMSFEYISSNMLTLVCFAHNSFLAGTVPSTLRGSTSNSIFHRCSCRRCQQEGIEDPFLGMVSLEGRKPHKDDHLSRGEAARGEAQAQGKTALYGS